MKFAIAGEWNGEEGSGRAGIWVKRAKKTKTCENGEKKQTQWQYSTVEFKRSTTSIENHRDRKQKRNDKGYSGSMEGLQLREGQKNRQKIIRPKQRFDLESRITSKDVIS